MRAEVLWGGDMPKEYREAAEPFVLKHGHLLPLWVAHVSVRMWADGDSSGFAARIATDYEYRQVKLELAAGFLNDSAKNRERTIVHEFFHAHMGPVRTFVNELTAHCIEDEPTRKLLFSQYHNLEEGVVQDMTFGVLPPVPPKRK